MPPRPRSRTETRQLVTIAGIELELVERRVKRLSLRVSPPDGRVRLTVPHGTPGSLIRSTVAERAAWIARHQQRFRALPQPHAARYETGETHYYAGEPYRLELRPGAPRRVTLEGRRLVMGVGPACDAAARERRLERWYRERLQESLPPLVERWAARLEVPVPHVGVKRMKTRWGSCNPRAARVWFALALARRRPELVAYIVVHEVAHLLVPDHGPRFKALMSRHVPRWRELDAELDAWPLWAPLPAGADLRAP